MWLKEIFDYFQALEYFNEDIPFFWRHKNLSNTLYRLRLCADRTRNLAEHSLLSLAEILESGWRLRSLDQY